jgi:hypothetical protein
LALFAAAFHKQVGSDKALDYYLIEQHSADGKMVRWFWQIKDELKNERRNEETQSGPIGAGESGPAKS